MKKLLTALCALALSTTALFAALLAPALAFAINAGKLVGFGWCRDYSARGHAAPWPIGLAALLVTQPASVTVVLPAAFRQVAPES